MVIAKVELIERVSAKETLASSSRSFGDPLMSPLEPFCREGSIVENGFELFYNFGWISFGEINPITDRFVKNAKIMSDRRYCILVRDAGLEVSQSFLTDGFEGILQFPALIFAICRQSCAVIEQRKGDQDCLQELCRQAFFKSIKFLI